VVVGVRENTLRKGQRYLAEARLTVLRVDKDAVEASCRGDGTVYKVAWNPDLGWSCDCPARSRCAHTHALQLVVVRDVEVAE
jgi:uncharacterized Zn finger protein